jgi:hypothetical protein
MRASREESAVQAKRRCARQSGTRRRWTCDDRNVERPDPVRDRNGRNNGQHGIGGQPIGGSRHRAKGARNSRRHSAMGGRRRIVVGVVADDEACSRPCLACGKSGAVGCEERLEDNDVAQHHPQCVSDQFGSGVRLVHGGPATPTLARPRPWKKVGSLSSLAVESGHPC